MTKNEAISRFEEMLDTVQEVAEMDFDDIGIDALDMSLKEFKENRVPQYSLDAIDILYKFYIDIIKDLSKE